jgi:hypothetical protein
MISVITTEVYVTSSGEQFTDKDSAEEQEAVDEVTAELQGEDLEERTVEDIIRLVYRHFILTRRITTETVQGELLDATPT